MGRDAVELQLQVTVSKQGKAGIRIHVIELGGSAGRNDVQTVKVSLTPLLSKEERIALFKQRHPARWHEIEQASVEATVREID